MPFLLLAPSMYDTPSNFRCTVSADNVFLVLFFSFLFRLSTFSVWNTLLKESYMYQVEQKNVSYVKKMAFRRTVT